MKTFCKVEGGVVTNRIVANDTATTWGAADETWISDETAQIGWTYDGATFTPPPMPPPPPPTAAQQRLAAFQADPTRAGLLTLLNGFSTPAQLQTYWNGLNATQKANMAFNLLLIIVTDARS